jgi:hypothetical protein
VAKPLWRDVDVPHISCHRPFNITHGNKNVSYHANMHYHADTFPNTDPSNDESDVPIVAHVLHSSKSHKEPTSSQLGFYEGHWSHILTLAKAQYRYHIHTDIPFLENNDKNLKVAHKCLLKADNSYMDDNKHIELDKG